MNRVLERIADRLAEVEFELAQARSYLRERDRISRENPTDENLCESRAAFAAVKEVEQAHEWVKSEIGMQSRER
jgi:hypothetical protein